MYKPPGSSDPNVRRPHHPETTTDQPPDGGESAFVVGFIVIAVPRSPQAPHAVLVNDALRFPKRNGSTTRYLSEPELAAAYRDRLVGSGAQTRRIEEIERDALARLDVRDLPWVAISLVPDLPGDFTISQKVYRQFQQEIIQTRIALFSSSHYTRAWTGRRRLLADGTGDHSPLARWSALDLHTDGSGVYAIRVADLTKRQEWAEAPTDRDAPPPVQLVDDESIVLGILSGLLCLAQHARDRAATGGGVLLRAQLHPEAYAKLGDELCDHVADLRGRQFLIMLSRGFACRRIAQLRLGTHAASAVHAAATRSSNHHPQLRHRPQ